MWNIRKMNSVFVRFIYLCDLTLIINIVTRQTIYLDLHVDFQDFH